MGSRYYYTYTSLSLPSISVPQLTTGADDAHTPSIPSTTTDDHLISSTSAIHPHSIPCSTLHCLADCHCRCHGLSMQSLIPGKLASYIGQIYVSKRLLRAPWATWSVCNVQTCRGDVQRAMTINWIIPPSFLSGFLQSSRDRRIQVSIGAARTIPWNAPILDAIWDADIQRVRSLFVLGQASIWDHDPVGSPILWVNQIIIYLPAPRMLLTRKFDRTSLHATIGLRIPAKNVIK